MNFEDIIRNINNKIFHPVYFLAGEEAYFIDKISKLIETSVLSDAEKEFNQAVVYGRDVDSSQIISLAREYPVFGNYRVVIVREAQDLRNIEKDEKLKSYLKNPVGTTLLVFDYKYKNLDKRTEFAKLLQKTGVLFTSKKLWDYQIPDQIEAMIKARGFRIGPATKMFLAENLGNNLNNIDNELNKLVINLQAGHEITPDIVEQNIGISKDYNVFELQKALGQRDVIKANRIVSYFAANPKENPAIKVIVMLYGYFRKIFLYHFIKDKSDNNVAAQLSVNRFFVKEYKAAAARYDTRKLRQVFSILREYDLKSKGVESAPIDDGELMKEMVYKILH